MAKAILILYNSALATSLLAAAAHITYASAGGHTYTLKGTYGVSDGDLTTYCGTTLVDATYDEIYIDSVCDGAAATSAISTLHQYLLYTKLKVASRGTLSAEITNATTATGTTLGDSGETWVVNAYTNAWLYLMGGTGTDQIATIKSNTSTVATIWGAAFATTPSTDTDFKILTGMKMYMCGLAHTTTAASSVEAITELAWAAIYPNNTLPLIMSFHGGQPSYALYTGTSTTLAAGALTDSGASWSTNAWAGMYCQIYSASTNSYQYAKITSNTGTVLTLTLMTATTYWSRGLTPTGNAIYKIVNQLSDVFNDEYSKVYIMTYLTDLTSSTTLGIYKDIMDSNLSMPTLPTKMSPIQNVKYVQGTILPQGKTIFDSLVAGAAL